MTILPTAYLPSIAYFAALLRGDCVVDLGEHFIKRSERNRTRILAADGPMALTAQVRHADRPRQPMREMRLDYSKRWQHRHWQALVSAYRSSPYFEHYAARFEPFYRREWRWLVDYDMEYTRTLLRLIGSSAEPRTSESYMEAAATDLDLRGGHGCRGGHEESPTFEAEPYVQVFSDRMPFVPNLSALDLLLCEGPSAIDAVLMRCRL